MKTRHSKNRKVETETEQAEQIRQLVSRQQVKEMAGCCIETIKRWEKRGILQPIKMSPRMVRYDLAQVQQAFADARVAA
jgi:hypothetical protein